MWSLNTFWFDVTIITSIFAIGYVTARIPGITYNKNGQKYKVTNIKPKAK